MACSTINVPNSQRQPQNWLEISELVLSTSTDLCHNSSMLNHKIDLNDIIKMASYNVWLWNVSLQCNHRVLIYLWLYGATQRGQVEECDKMKINKGARKDNNQHPYDMFFLYKRENKNEGKRKGVDEVTIWSSLKILILWNYTFTFLHTIPKSCTMSTQTIHCQWSRCWVPCRYAWCKPSDAMSTPIALLCLIHVRSSPWVKQKTATCILNYMVWVSKQTHPWHFLDTFQDQNRDRAQPSICRKTLI